MRVFEGMGRYLYYRRPIRALIGGKSKEVREH